MLHEIGVLEKVRKVAVHPPEILLRSYRDGRVLDVTQPSPDMEAKYGFPYLTIHRADLRSILYQAALDEGVSMRFGIKVNWQNSEIDLGVLTSDEGHKFNANLIIAADGEHSEARAVLAGEERPLKPTDRVVDRILVKVDAMARAGLAELLDPPNIHVWLGPNSMVVTYQLRGVFNIALCRSMHTGELVRGPRAVEHRELTAFFADWEPNLRKLVDLGHGFLEWSLSEPLERFTHWIHPSSKMILIGDASDTYLPYL